MKVKGTSRSGIRMLRFFSCTEVFVLSLLFLFTCCFTLSALDWAYGRNRTSLQSILTRMSPYMTPVSSNPETEKYYGVWRYHDFRADFYREPREPDVIPSIPIIYVHGNAGCFRDMRSLGRFIGEYNVKLRKERARDFADDVRRKLFALHKRDGRPMPVDGEVIPHSLQREAEELVIAETPILSTELFGVDFLEESNTHNSVLLIKEARFLNYTVHSLLDKLLQHYGDGSQESIDATEQEYLHSICSGASASSPCATARAQTEQYSTAQRIQAELAHVRREGLWLWTESLGGIVALFAALMAPELYAGLVMAGSPLRYPPLLFDLGCLQFQRTVHHAAVALPLPPLLSAADDGVDWSAVFPPASSAGALRQRVAGVPAAALARRLARVALLNVHGGGLEDVVPPRTSFLLRSSGRVRQRRAPASRAESPRAVRRDVCTEELRDCGASLSHRGLVYAEQLLDSAGRSLVRAAQTPGAGALIGQERLVPRGAQRIFPMVVESLPASTESWRREEFFFVRSLRAKKNGELFCESPFAAVEASTVELCADAQDEVNLQTFPREEDDNAESWDPLHIFLGLTSYLSSEVHFPELRFVTRDGSLFSGDVMTRAATRLHLPIRRKDSVADEKSAFRTVISFSVHTHGNRSTTPVWLRPRFCFRVDKEAAKLTEHKIFMQYDRMDPLTNGTAQHSKDLSVEHHGRFALIRNIDSMHMETQLAVRVDNASVFPHVICGSLRSFRLALRGMHDVDVDEPESQLQYFYGPFEKGLRDFEYSWRPFHTTPFNLTNLYVVYVLSAERQPEVALRDLSLYQFPQWNTLEYWVWRLQRWRMRWMAVLATFSISGKFGGSYTLLFFTLYVFFGVRQSLGSGSLLHSDTKRRVNLFSHLFLVLVFGVLLECVSMFLAEHALKVCLLDDPPLLSDEEMTGMMGVMEKLTLLLLYALPPNYAECRVSWIRLQTVVPRDVLFEHLMHLGSGFCVAVILFAFERMVFSILGIVSRCARNVVEKISLKCTNYTLARVLVTLWFIPVFLCLFVPWLHISVITTIACIFTYCAIWQIPHKFNNNECGHNYRWLCFWVTMVVHFLSHFEGLVLDVRNYIIVSRDVLDDHERFVALPEHQAAFVVTQFSLAVVYTTIFLTRLHAANLTDYSVYKKKECERSQAGKKSSNYVLGSFCKDHLFFRRALCVCHRLLMFVSFWVCLVALRRPLEGFFPLLGVSLLAMYLSIRLVMLW